VLLDLADPACKGVITVASIKVSSSGGKEREKEGREIKEREIPIKAIASFLSDKNNNNTFNG
jgi:hypothetical protein